MLNNEKITLMTRLAIYEQNNDKREISVGKYFKGDYIAIQMVKSFFAVTAAYALCIFLWILYKSDEVISSLATTTDLTRMVIILVIIYLAMLIPYMILSYMFFSYKFKSIRRNLKEYNGDLKKLHKIQEKEFDAIIDDLEEGGEE